MSKATLKVETPVGEFTRATATPYQYVVVWNSPRAKAAFEAKKYANGVQGRWVKDRGFGVTWHGSEGAAINASRKYLWDDKVTLVGVFKVASA